MSAISSVRFRNLALGLVALLLAGCGLPAKVDEPPVDMGNFRLGFNIVVVDGPQIGPFSRKATDEEWQAALTRAIDRRFGSYQGDKYYHIGVKLDGYALARAGVPVVFTPKSFVVVTVNIWDDATQTRLNTEEKALSVFEGISGKSIIGTGLVMTRDQQMELLANNTAKAIQDWILQNPEWIGLPPRAGDASNDTTGDAARGDGQQAGQGDAAAGGQGGGATGTPGAQTSPAPGN